MYHDKSESIALEGKEHVWSMSFESRHFKTSSLENRTDF